MRAADRLRQWQARLSGERVWTEGRSNQLPELSVKKMNATNASSEPHLKHAKMIILLKKIRVFSLEIQTCLSCVCTRILPLKLKLYSAGMVSDSDVDLWSAKMRLYL